MSRTTVVPRGAAAHQPQGERTGGASAADVFVAFGITGDLAKVMTFRSLYRLERRGLLHCPILGVAVDDWDAERLRAHARAAIEGTGEAVDDEVFARFAARLSYVSGDFGDPATYERVRDAMGDAVAPVFYLEIPPFLFGRVVEGLSGAGLTDNARVVVEKPFGHDRASARRAERPAAGAPPARTSSTASTTSWGRWGCARCSTCASPTRCSSRSGTATTSPRCRSRWPRSSASRTAATSTTRSARCATSWSTT